MSKPRLHRNPLEEQSLSVIESFGGQRDQSDLSFSEKIGYLQTASGFTSFSCFDPASQKENMISIESSKFGKPLANNFSFKNLKTAFEQQNQNEQDLRQLKDELMQFQQESQRWDRERGEYVSTIKALETQVSELIADNQKILAQLFLKSEDGVSAREKSIKQIESELNLKWSAEVKYLEKQLKEKSAELEQSKPKMVESMSMISQLQEQLSLSGEKAEQQQRTIHKLRKKLDTFFDDSLLRELNKEKELNQRLIEKIKEKDIDHENKIQMITSHQYDFKQENLYLLEQIKHLELKIEESISEKEEMIKELEQLKQIKVYLETKMKFYQDDQEAHSTQFAELKSQYEQKLQESQDLIHSFQRKLMKEGQQQQSSQRKNMFPYYEQLLNQGKYDYRPDPSKNTSRQQLDTHQDMKGRIDFFDESNYQSQTQMYQKCITCDNIAASRKSMEQLKRSTEKRRSANFNGFAFE